MTGVFIPRRDTSSRISALVGGRLFPGWQHPARFDVSEVGDRYEIRVASTDGDVSVEVTAHVSESPMPGSVFASVEVASAFFRCAPVGYAATPCTGVFDGVELGTEEWNLTSLHVERATSSFFDDATRFPRGTATLDSAFLMAQISTRWHPQPQLVAPVGANFGAAKC